MHQMHKGSFFLFAAAAVAVIFSPANAALIVSLEPSGVSGDGSTWTSSVGSAEFARNQGDSTLSAAAGGVQYLGSDVSGIEVGDDAYRSNVDASNVDGTDLTGAAARTTEVWVLNPTVETEEAVVTWGRRGGDAKLHALNYASSAGFGALGLWGGGFDTGYTSVPTANEWHHIAYVYDGATNYKVYVDGVLNVDRTLGGTLATDPGPFNLFAQNNGGGDADLNDAYKLSGALNSVRIWNDARDASTVQASFQAGPLAIPEPSALVLLLVGLAAATVRAKR